MEAGCNEDLFVAGLSFRLLEMDVSSKSEDTMGYLISEFEVIPCMLNFEISLM